MLVGLVHWAIFIYVGLFATARLSFAAGEPLKLKIIYSSFTGAYAPLWLAVEDRLGRKYGLDFEAVYAGRARPHQLLLSGDSQYVVSTGTGVELCGRRQRSRDHRVLHECNGIVDFFKAAD